MSHELCERREGIERRGNAYRRAALAFITMALPALVRREQRPARAYGLIRVLRQRNVEAQYEKESR